MISSAALASPADPATSTANPAPPSRDFRMPDRRSSSSITNSRTGLSPVARAYGAFPNLRQYYGMPNQYYLSARCEAVRRYPDLRIMQQQNHPDADRDDHEGERVEGRGITVTMRKPATIGPAASPM